MKEADEMAIAQEYSSCKTFMPEKEF